MIELVLVRHAQPDWEPGGRAVDHPSLSAHGRQQAEALADALAGERFDACYTSTLRRAIETSEPIARKLGVQFERCGVLWREALDEILGRKRQSSGSASLDPRGLVDLVAERSDLGAGAGRDLADVEVVAPVQPEAQLHSAGI